MEGSDLVDILMLWTFGVIICQCTLSLLSRFVENVSVIASEVFRCQIRKRDQRTSYINAFLFRLDYSPGQHHRSRSRISRSKTF
jgi:hypothetical protein